MPTPISWTLISPPPASGGTAGTASPGGTGVAAPFLPCPIDPYTQQDLLDLFDRLLPASYLEPLKSPGPGYELYQMVSAIGARCSLAVERFSCGAYILSSTGGSFATGVVELYRGSVQPEGIAVTVKAGTIVKSSKGGRRYLTTADVLFGPEDLGPFTVGIQGETRGYEYNEPGIVVTADGTSLEGEIDSIDVLVETAPSQPLANFGTATVSFSVQSLGVQTISGMTGGSFSPDSVGRFVTMLGAIHAANNGNRQIMAFIDATSIQVRNAAGVSEVATASVEWQEYSAATDVGDLTIQVRQPSATGGGSDAFLDAHGKDRGTPRGDGEPDDSYRGRIRALPDNISPDAVNRALQQLMFPFNLSFGVVETWEPTYQTCWDAPRDAIPGSPYDPNVFVYDDPFPPSSLRNRWLDLNDMRGAFIVLLPNPMPIRDLGQVYYPPAGTTAQHIPADPPYMPAGDHTDLNPVDYTNPGGLRAVPAYDVPTGIGFGLLEGSYDGFDLPRRTLYKTIFQTLQKIKAAGTSASVELEGV